VRNFTPSTHAQQFTPALPPISICQHRIAKLVDQPPEKIALDLEKKAQRLKMENSPEDQILKPQTGLNLAPLFPLPFSYLQQTRNKGLF
jgi:hypothetical protein